MTPASQRPITRRLSLILAAAVTGATVLFASLATSGLSAPQGKDAPAIAEAAVTEAGRARQVSTFATNWKQSVDPLVTMPSGIQAKASNYHGVLIDGTRYYYNVAPHVSYDPLGRGDVSFNDIVVKERILVEDGFSVLVYTLPR